MVRFWRQPKFMLELDNTEPAEWCVGLIRDFKIAAVQSIRSSRAVPVTKIALT